MINNRSVPSPGNIQGWSDKGVTCNADGRAGWDAAHLEGLIREKIKQKIASGNGQVWEAFRLFCGGGETDEVTPEIFKTRVSQLLNTQLSDEEVRGVFDKYDEDGGGSISLDEICNGIFGLDFAKRSKGRDSIEDSLKWEHPEGYEACPSPVLPGYGGHVPGGRDMYGAYAGRADSPVKTREEYQATSPREAPRDGCASPVGVGAFPGHASSIITNDAYTSYINVNLNR